MGGDCEASRFAHVNFYLYLVFDTMCTYVALQSLKCTIVTFWLKLGVRDPSGQTCNCVSALSVESDKVVLALVLSLCVVCIHGLLS